MRSCRVVPCLCALLSLFFSPLAATAREQEGARIRVPKKYSIEQFTGTTNFSEASFSHDERSILFTSDESGVPNVYTQQLNGGPATAITTSTTNSTYAVSYFPADDRVLYTRDQGGNENSHIYVRLSDGSERDLTPGEDVKGTFLEWASNSREFFISTNERDRKFFDLYKVDTATFQKRLFFQNPGTFEIVDISPDQKWVALARPISTSDGEIHLADVKTGRLVHLTPHDEPTNFLIQTFDVASKKLYYLSDAGTEFARLMSYDLASGRHAEVERAAWDIRSTVFSAKGRYRVTVVNADARSVLRIVGTRSGKQVRMPEVPPGEIHSVTISRRENLVAFYLSGDRSPADLYVYDFRSAKLTRLTNALGKEIDPADLVDSEVVGFRSSDGLTIPSILYKPAAASATEKAPAVLYVHGGPGDQSRQDYRALLQFIANQGYVVLAINNRGSSGYGKTFFAADDKRHGKEPLRDCIEGKSYLAGLPYVDADRIAIMGASYGGFMVLAALTFFPEEFTAGVNIFGVSNWLRTLENMPTYWESSRLALYKEMGDPIADKEMLREISPLFHAARIRRPMMVLQGANDPRVIKLESDDIVEAVRRNGVPVEYLVFPDEGHGFSKKSNKMKAWQGILEFLDRYVKNV